MSSRAVKGLIAAALGALLAMGTMPAGAASAYHMNGQGSLTLAGGGLPACMGGQGNCTSADISFSWGELTVQGLGVLQNANVAGQYKCASEGSVGGDPFLSKIRGNSSNFELTFNFQCTPSSGIGPAFINGWFSNVTGNASDPYQSTDGHPHPTPVAKGVFTFKGFFVTSNLHPYDVTKDNGAPMSCSGGFAPTAMNGLNVTTAAFFGQCDAVAG